MNNEVEIETLIKRTNELLTVLVKSELSGILETELSDVKKKKLYDLTGKSLTGRQISEKISMSIASISRTWCHWEEVGLLIKDGKKYRKILDG